MEYLLVVGLLLLSPAILIASLVFPFFWIGQYRLLRNSGSWPRQREFQARWARFTGKGIAVAYVLCVGAILLPGVFPTVSAFLWSGWMFAITIPVVMDLAILMAYSPDVAVEQWKGEQKAGGF